MNATERSRPPSIGIVGAGFSGLRCADVLLQHGCDVLIFEARDRLGGRVAQSNHLGNLVDLGPNWIHGTQNNPISDIALSTKTTLHTWSEVLSIFSSTGSSLPPKEAEEHISLLWDDDGLIDEAFEYSNSHRDAIDPNRSLYDFFVEKSADLFENEAPAEAQRKRENFLKVTRMWGAYVGSDVRKQSLRYFWLEDCTTEAEMPFVAETYHKILTHVARRAKEGARIKYGCEVVGVVSEEFKGGDGRVRVQAAQGTEETFDAVVVTCPLGWLKQNQTAFHPSLPPELSQAIDNIGYGTLDKVYITFPSAFWDEPQPRTSDLTNGIDHESKTQHSPPPQEPAEPFSSDVLFLSPTYAPVTNPQSWPQECMLLTALPGSCAHLTLLFYIFGDCSKHIASLATSASASPNPKLVEFFKPYYSLLPNYSPTNPSCTPLAILATAWANDKFAGYGSYSNFPVGSKRADKDVEVMREGMPERGVWFAGEHTAPVEALGTTNGAYLSGERVAGRILEKFGIDGRKAGWFVVRKG